MIIEETSLEMKEQAVPIIIEETSLEMKEQLKADRGDTLGAVRDRRKCYDTRAE